MVLTSFLLSQSKNMNWQTMETCLNWPIKILHFVTPRRIKKYLDGMKLELGVH